MYNTGGYDALPYAEALDGVIDIYMPDFKFADKRTPGSSAGPSIIRRWSGRLCGRCIGRWGTWSPMTGALLVAAHRAPSGDARSLPIRPKQILRFIAREVSRTRT